MMDGMSSARGRRNWMESIVEKIPGFRGYLERESRRDVDKMQRDYLAEQVDRGRHELQWKIRDWSRGGQLDNLDLASSLEKLLDRFANRIRHADYGTAGFFDAVKIGEAELEALYQFDLHMVETVQDLSARIGVLPPTAASVALRSLMESAEAADRLFDERQRCIEDITDKGVR